MFQWLTQRIQHFINRKIDAWVQKADKKWLTVDTNTTTSFRSLQPGVRVRVNDRTHVVTKVETTPASDGHPSETLVSLDGERLLNIHDGHIWYVWVTKGTNTGFRFTRWKPQPLDEIVAPDIHLSRR